MSLIPAMELFIPAWPDLIGWAGVLIASFALIGLGRVSSLGRAAPEAALLVGWGAAVLMLTLWGVATMMSLRWPAAALLVLGLSALLAPKLRLTLADWRGLARMAAVALPLLAVMASARPSLPDTFLNLLPNAAYLYDHATFPADDRWPSYSLLPGAPYNMQLAAFLASFFTRGFAPSAMIAFNIVLQLAFALLLARVLERREDRAAVPSWTAAALALLLATALNPGFVPRYDFSSYSEASVTVSVAFAAWFAARALERQVAKRSAAPELALLALTLAALINIKQDSVALAAGIVIAAGAVALLERREQRWRSLAALALASLPAVLLYLAWRWYVLEHFALGELKPLPLAQWQFAHVPLILRSMAGVILQKPYFFGLVVLTAIGLGWRVRHVGLNRAARVAALFLGTALLYNAALFVAYIGHFPGEIGADAHSYFRYNTHLGLLLVLALVLLGRDAVAERFAALGARRFLPLLLFGLILLCPVVFLRFLRFDLEEPQLRAWQVAALADQALTQNNRLALLLPGDNGSLATMLEGLIRFTPPRHVDADVKIINTTAPTEISLDRLELGSAEGYAHVLLSCMATQPGNSALAQAVLLVPVRLVSPDAHEWRVTASSPFPPPRSRRWSSVLAPAPLCLGQPD